MAAVLIRRRTFTPRFGLGKVFSRGKNSTTKNAETIEKIAISENSLFLYMVDYQGLSQGAPPAGDNFSPPSNVVIRPAPLGIVQPETTPENMYWNSPSPAAAVDQPVPN